MAESLVSVLTRLLDWCGADAPACDNGLHRVSHRLYLNIRKNSSADFRGSFTKSEITATESAPASMTDWQVARVIPPIATNGLRVRERAWRTPSSPITGSGLALLNVPNTGPTAM